MNVIVAAGGIPEPDEPLYRYTQGGHKATLDICGKPMIQWVLDALAESSQVESVIITGLPPDTDLSFPRPLTFLESSHDLFTDIQSGVEKLKEMNVLSKRTLLVSSDIPTITTNMLDWFINDVEKTDHEFYYPIITREIMEARFPSSRRTYLKLKDIEVCGGDIIAIRSSAAFKGNPIWSSLIKARKNPIKQAWLLGLDTLFYILFHLLTIEKAEKIIGKRIKLDGKVLLVPFAEIGMDVDKPHQLEAVCQELKKRRLQ